MNTRVIKVPVSLLLDPAQTPTTKVIWMAQRLHPAAGPAELQTQTGLSRHTVLTGLTLVKAYNRPPGGPRVSIPGALLAERSVGARAKVLYGLLQTTEHFRGRRGQFTYATLSAGTQTSPNTLKLAMFQLAGAGWVQTNQAKRLDPLKFTLGTPAQMRSQAEAALADRRLKRGQFTGEAIMQEYLSLLIDSNQFTDNARPGFLINPQTGERLELDRYYQPHKVAFEFHGTQHERATARFTQAMVDAQHQRDLVKAGICLYEGIHLVIIRADDLSLRGMTRRIGQCMPLRNVDGHELLIDLLEETSLTYRAEAAAASKPGA
ncbi:MAG TPA: hypothetical protein VNT01_12055 [Symbiobacteriaceae bacterium]|nr:hypothetical protein [Symbiobacteriaceae bacterium]